MRRISSTTSKRQNYGKRSSRFSLNSLAEDLEAYGEGAILYMYFENFITYDRCECYPGPHMNMVMGPNGSGKSTMVAAMVLGLGWPPSILGRSKDCSEFIKYGQERAVLELALKYEGSLGSGSEAEVDDNDEAIVHYTNGVLIIRREMSRVVRSASASAGVNSDWWINNQPQSLRVVQSVVRSLQVQIDNLCQFLPQDKVSEFARLTPAELLVETERAAAPPSILEAHEQLKKWRVDETKTQELLEQANRQLASLTKQDASMEAILTRIRERETLVEQLHLAERKRPFLLYERAREAYEEARYARDRARTDLERAEESLAPIKEQLAILEGQLKRLEKEINHSTQNLDGKIQKIDKIFGRGGIRDITGERPTMKNNSNGIDELIKRADALRAQIIKLREQRVRRETTIVELKQVIRNLEEELRQKSKADESVEPEKQVISERREREWSELGEQLDAFEREVGEAENQETRIKREGERHERDINSISLQLRDLEDVRKLRLESIERLAPDVSRAYQWLEEHRNIFKDRVYGPMAIEVNLKENLALGKTSDREAVNRLLAREVESLISKTSLLGFVVTNVEDLECFQQHLCDDQQLKVNVTLVEEREKSENLEFRPLPRDVLQKLGFIGTIEEIIEAPSAVITVLRDYPKIHLMPIAINSILFETIDNQLGLSAGSGERWLQKYATPEGTFEIKFSRYEDGEFAIKCTPLKNSIFLTTSGGTGGNDRKTALVERIKMIRGELAKSTERMRRILQEKESLRQRKQILQEHREQLMEEIKQEKARKLELKRLKEGIEIKKTNLGKLVAAERAGHDREEEEASLDQLCLLYTQQGRMLVETSENLAGMAKELMEQLAIRIVRMEWLEHQIGCLKEEIKASENQFEGLKMVLQEAEQLMQLKKNQAKELLERAIKGEELDDATKEAFSTLPESLEELEQHIALTRTRLEMCEAGGGINMTVLKEHEERKVTITELRKSAAQLLEKFKSLESRMEDLQSQTWVPALESMASTISSRFSGYFAQMGCAGEVRLVPAGRDYDRWSLEILVKFRDEENLQVLSGYRQSGGEKSVSTILFLLALQELTHCPFRVVDEINQGMDAYNERRVHALIVDAATRQVSDGGHSPQYYIITLCSNNFLCLDTF